jgi:hypothetical protein
VSIQGTVFLCQTTTRHDTTHTGTDKEKPSIFDGWQGYNLLHQLIIRILDGVGDQQARRQAVLNEKGGQDVRRGQSTNVLDPHQRNFDQNHSNQEHEFVHFDIE